MEEISPALLASVLFAALVLGFCLVAAGLDRVLVTAPLVFVGIGSMIGFAVGGFDTEQVIGIKLIAEVTLVLILFHDAASVRPREAEEDRKGIGRLLLVGFPLTVLVGWGAATLVFPELSPMFALLLAAALAPTDAGLGAPTVLNPVVPARVRRLLNVESGLNDGLATPIVLFAVASVAGSEGIAGSTPLVDAVLELTVGVVVGVVIGAVGGLLITVSKLRGTSSSGSRSLAVLMIPLLAYGVALLASGNGFVAAFISGMAFAGTAKVLARDHSVLLLVEQLANPLGYGVWLVFGIAAAPLVWSVVGWREALFAVLALTVLRMLPTAIALLGSGMRAPTIAFIGWFGPRGLASIVFGLIALESLAENDPLEIVLATISLTVLLSVVAHGVSAAPLAERYGHWVQRVRPEAELGAAAESRTRDSRLRLFEAPGEDQPPGSQ